MGRRVVNEVGWHDPEKLREAMRHDFMEQLERKGLTQRYYESLVDDYLEMWDIKNHLIEDIKARGVTVEYNNGGGQTGYKKNDSVPELNKTNGQMLKVLSELGLRGADVKLVDEDETL